MPTISVFIRKEDIPRWKALEDKSQWLHDNLPKGQTPARSSSPLGDLASVLDIKQPQPLAEEVESLLIDAGLEPTEIYGKAWSPDREGYVRYEVINGQLRVY